jgi:hypothetical protein
MLRETLIGYSTRIAGAGLVLALGLAVAQTQKPGPTFTVKDEQLRAPLSFIVYGDQRFTDPQNGQSIPAMRQLLVKQIATENPAAVILNGDVPNSGMLKDDYAVYENETLAWRESGLLIIAALGNHEMHGDEKQCLENWWNAFPNLRNRRWYSTQLGSRVYVISLDSTSSLLSGSEQARWLAQQIDGIGKSVDFVVITLHQPAAQRICAARLSCQEGADHSCAFPGQRRPYTQLRTA